MDKNANKKYTIAVAGTGNVGLSSPRFLDNIIYYDVDIIPEKVELINKRKSLIQDKYIEKYLAEKNLDLTVTLDTDKANSAEFFVVIAAPTNVCSTKSVAV